MLRETGVPFEAVDVLDAENNPGVRDAVKEFSNWPTIPQLFVNGELIGGADIISEMHMTGQLVTTLRSSPSGEASADSVDSADVPRGEIALVEDARRPTATLISDIIKSKFDLWSFKLIDDSSAHEGDAGALEMGLTSESHFNVELVAKEFEGLTPMQRQQKVFDALNEKDVMKRVHALSLVTRTPAEMAKLEA
jgi:stress-induced morphogen/glutaredoxin